MKTGKKGLGLIKSFEGLKLTAYLCPANVWTIGYGSTHGVREGDRLGSEAEAEELLARDLGQYEDAVNKYVTVDLTQEQFDALVSFTYNLGAGAFKGSTLLRFVNQKDFVGAADQFLRWNKAGGRVLAGLTRRRVAERELFLS